MGGGREEGRKKRGRRERGRERKREGERERENMHEMYQYLGLIIMSKRASWEGRNTETLNVFFQML
jgi:hypothetical protein